MSRRVLIYVQHLLGIGHLARTARIAAAAAAAGLTVRVVSGGEPVASLSFGGAEVVQLPPVRTADVTFSGLVDASGAPLSDDAKAARRTLLLETARAFDPDVILLEMFPFGRRQMRFEIVPLLEAFAGRVPAAVSIRDVLADRIKPKKAAYILETIERFRLGVLVHGDPALIPFEATFPEAKQFLSRLHYTGYIAPARSTAPADATGEVLVSAGGGAVGGPVFRAALAARPLTGLADRPWRLVTGANLPAAERDALRAAAPDGVTVTGFESDFASRLAGAAVSVSQAGYNTVIEGLAAAVPMVLIPFAEGGESEQGLRARHLAERGWVEHVQPGPDGGSVDPKALALAIDRAMVRGRPDVTGLKINGAVETARLLGELAR